MSGTEEYFNSSRLKVIGLITAGVVLVGALGGIAGIAFDPETEQKPEPAESPVGAPGSVGGQHKSVGPPAGVDGAAALAAAGTKGRGEFYQFPNGVQFWVPQSWRIDGGTDTTVYLSDGKASFAFVATARVNPRASAGQVLTKNLKSLLPRANYTQLEVGGPYEWSGAFGTVLSSSWLEYSALWVDNQGSAPIYGQIYSAVRRDGATLVVLIEHIPPDKWNKAFPPMGNLVYNSYGRFAGVH